MVGHIEPMPAHTHAVGLWVPFAIDVEIGLRRSPAG